MQFVKHSFLALAVVALAGHAHADKKAAGKTAKPAMGTATVMKLDPAASQITWEGSKKLVKSSHNGTVKLKSGEVVMAGDMLTGGTFEIDMTSIDNQDLASSPKDKAKLEGHLKNDDFFAVDKNPTATFKISTVKPLKPAKAGDPTHEVTGDLTIKGKTNPITFPAVVTTTAGKTEAKANFVIDRTKWDIRYSSEKFFENLAGDRIISDNINLDLKLVAKK